MNILLTSVGRRTYVVNYFIEAMEGQGRVIASNSSYTSALASADSYRLTPLIYDKEYIDAILEICAIENIGAIVSLFDIDLPILAKNSNLFRSVGARLIGPSVDTALIANDKIKTRDFFIAHGINTPSTVDSLDEAEMLLASRELRFPLIVKPRWGMGSIGIYLASDLDELRVLYKKCRREVFSSYLRYESKSDPDKSVVIQEFASGEEHGIDIFKDLDGNFCGLIAKKKIAMRSGETDIGETVFPSDFSDVVQEISAGMDFTGILSFDCFVDKGRVTGIEINPRISGHYPFSHLAGARYPRQLIDWIYGKPTTPEYLRADVGVRGCKELLPIRLLG